MESIYKKILNNLETSKKYKDNVFFSIIIPVYNTEKYLKRCLDSVLNQSFKDLEIIIIDDCSTGNCREIVFSYDDKRIKYIKNEQNLGSAWSRINGVQYSNGKYIHFVDSDDWVVDECYKKLYKYLKSNFDAIYFNGIYADDEKTWEFDFHIPGKSKLYGNRIAFDSMFFNDAQRRTLWCRIFKRSIVLEGIKYMPQEYTSVADDWILNLFILFYAKNYITVPDIFYYYYQSNPNSVTAIVENKINNFISFTKLNNNLKQLYISYNSVVDFLKCKKIWNIYRYSWVLYIIRDLKYSFIKPFNNFDPYFKKLYHSNKEQYLNESLEYFSSNISNLNVLTFLYKNLLDASGGWERNMFKYAFISYSYRIYKAITRIRNYPQALLNISITKTTEHRRMYITFLGFNLTIKLKPKK